MLKNDTENCTNPRDSLLKSRSITVPNSESTVRTVIYRWTMSELYSTAPLFREGSCTGQPQDYSDYE